MKNLFLIAALTSAAKFSFSQSLQKENVLGFHVMTIDLKPHATMISSGHFISANSLNPDLYANCTQFESRK